MLNFCYPFGVSQVKQDKNKNWGYELTNNIGYFLTEILTIIFINCKNPDPAIASEAKYYNEKLKNFYRHLEETLEQVSQYKNSATLSILNVIQPSLVPYIDLIFKLGSGSLEDKEKDNNSQGTLSGEFLHQTSLINNINGLEWSGNIVLIDNHSLLTLVS